jgi:hypothetical protein
MIFGVSAWKANEAPVVRRVLSPTASNRSFVAGASCHR